MIRRVGASLPCSSTAPQRSSLESPGGRGQRPVLLRGTSDSRWRRDRVYLQPVSPRRPASVLTGCAASPETVVAVRSAEAATERACDERAARPSSTQPHRPPSKDQPKAEPDRLPDTGWEVVRIVVELRRRSSWVDGQTVTGSRL